MKRIFLLSILSLSFVFVKAQFVENFTFTTTGNVANDTLTNPNLAGAIWKRHSGSSGPISYNSTGLVYAGFPGSGVGGAVNFQHIASTSREDANAQIPAVTSGSVYCSSLLRLSAVPAATADYHMHFGGTFGNVVTGFFGRLFIKEGSTPGTNFKIGVAKNSTSATLIDYSTTDYALNTTYLVVLKYTFNTVSSTDDRVSVYIFASGIPSTEPSVPNLYSKDTLTSDATSLASICIRQGVVSAGLVGVIDGIRVSNTWANSALPVTLAGFSADLKENKVELNWSTSSETNNKGFEIERSVDGNNFSKIAFVKGAGNSNRLNKYHFADDYSSSAYYRLKQLDFDGKFEYSKVIAVKAEKEDLKVELSPNPFGNRITIQSNNQISKVEIIDITGKVKLVEIINGKTAEINTSEISNGIYFLRINDGETILTQRIIKN
jgi:hypothetical protein